MKLAIVVIGDQDSGKSSTMKGLVNNYCDRKIGARIVSSWRAIYLNQSFHSLNIWIYFFASSCSERNKEIALRIDEKLKGNLPEVLWIAVQRNGHLRQNTMDFLAENYDEVLEYELSNQFDGTTWGRFDTSDEDTILSTRANTIISAIKKFINDYKLLE